MITKNHELENKIKKSKSMLLSGKWVELEIIVLSEINQIDKDKAFVLMWMESVRRQEGCQRKRKIIGIEKGREKGKWGRDKTESQRM